MSRSLKNRALQAVLVLLVYLVGSGFFVARERAQLDAAVREIEALTRHEKVLAVAFAAVSAAVTDATEAGHASPNEPASTEGMRPYVESCTRTLEQLEAIDAIYARPKHAMLRSWDTLVATPTRAHWLDLREVLDGLAGDFEARLRAVGERRESMSTAYRREYDQITWRTLALAAIGMLGFAAAAAWFFRRLAGDIERLEAHARAVVQGRRGVVLPVERDDELGRLMDAVNRMEADLDEREQKIALEGEKRSHQDKMQAVGALAAGVAHEVNNPLAVIVGTARALRDDASTLSPSEVAEHARLIGEHAERAAQVARRLAEAAAPQPHGLGWVDVNALVRRLAQLLGYDRRLRGLEFELALDPTVPAIRTSAEALQHAVLRLLTWAAESTRAAHQISQRVTTAHMEGGRVEICMMLPADVDLASPRARRLLVLSQSIIGPLGAELRIEPPLDCEGHTMQLLLLLSPEAPHPEG